MNNARPATRLSDFGNANFDELRCGRTLAVICPIGMGMNVPVETRGERYRAVILRAFVELIFRDGFEKISVQAIVAEAGVARSTFYEHFSGKDDALRASMAQFFEVLARCPSSDDQPSELLQVLGHFWKNRRLTDAIFAGTPRRILALSLSEMIEARLRERGETLLLPARLVAIQLAEAQLALVESWLRGRAFARTEDVAAALHRSSRESANSLINVS